MTTTIADPWLPILTQLKLSKSERVVVERYQNAPLGRTFLPIADILLSHQLVDECIELLMQGVERHPRFTVARVILARELFNRGLMAQAWQTLSDSPEPLHENVLAQKIRFKLALVLGLEKEAREIHGYIQSRRMFDDETKHLGELLERQGFNETRRVFRDELVKKGIAVVEDSMPQVTTNPEPAAAWSSPEDEDELAPSDPLASFHVVPLREIFALAFDGATHGSAKQGVELDSTTLAEIYESQGHYQKAMDVYRRLLKLSPNSEYLQRKVSELNRLRNEQRQEDLSVDPSIVEQMESVEIINGQIRYLNQLLTQLG